MFCSLRLLAEGVEAPALAAVVAPKEVDNESALLGAFTEEVLLVGGALVELHGVLAGGGADGELGRLGRDLLVLDGESLHVHLELGLEGLLADGGEFVGWSEWFVGGDLVVGAQREELLATGALEGEGGRGFFVEGGLERLELVLDPAAGGGVADVGAAVVAEASRLHFFTLPFEGLELLLRSFSSVVDRVGQDRLRRQLLVVVLVAPAGLLLHLGKFPQLDLLHGLRRRRRHIFALHARC